MMTALLAASLLAAGPPAILQVYREPLKPGVEAEYDRLESENTREEAETLASGAKARAFAVRRSWSHLAGP